MHGCTTQGAREGKGRSLEAGSKQASKCSGMLHTALDLLFSCRMWSGERGSGLVQGQCLGRSRWLRVKGRAMRGLEALCYDTDCSIGTDYDTASVRKRPRTYLGITICLPFIFDSTRKVPDSCTVQENSVADGSASEALQTSCTVQGLCTVHGDVLPSLYCTWRRSPFSVRYIAMPHSHTCIKGS